MNWNDLSPRWPGITNSFFFFLQVGIATGETGGKVGTFALAYAAHKAASPIRFPPTVALTPVVASWIGKIRKGGE
jgi:hypothetical protein